MIKKLIFFLFCVVSLFLASCSTMKDFYTSFFEEDYVFPEGCLLAEGEEPEVYYTYDLSSMNYSMLSNYYFCMGISTYNGPLDNSLKDKVYNLCLEKGAKVGVYAYDYSYTKTGAYTSTIGRSVYLNTYSIPRYDYKILLYGKLPQTLIDYYSIVGISATDLSTTKQLETKCNTGAYILTVFNGTPAYYANLSSGDVIIKINNFDITSEADYTKVVNALAYSGEQLRITYVREGIEKNTILRIL